jgi:hypothetical protein
VLARQAVVDRQEEEVEVDHRMPRPVRLQLVRHRDGYDWHFLFFPLSPFLSSWCFFSILHSCAFTSSMVL